MFTPQQAALDDGALTEENIQSLADFSHLKLSTIFRLTVHMCGHFFHLSYISLDLYGVYIVEFYFFISYA
jgi:hypothetical protein